MTDDTQASRANRTWRPRAGEDPLGRTPPHTPHDPSGRTRPHQARDRAEQSRRSSAADTRRERSPQGDPSTTRRVPTAGGGARPSGGTPRRRGPVWWHWLLGIPLYGLLVLGVAGLAGYWTGLNERGQAEAALANLALREQFDLGVDDLLGTRYELAQQRFEYILSVDPHYPGALELLEQARAALNQPTMTPSPPPSPTPDVSPSPTLNLGSLEGLFAAAQAAQLQGDWDGVIQALLVLRDQSPDYRRQEANELLYAALRSRGLQKIWNGQQEQGIYDLRLAQRLAPLDGQAQSWVNSAAFYLFANSYYGLDWALATQHFGQICRAGVWDSCFKFARAAWEYADVLLKEAEDPCAAVQQYEVSLNTIADSGRAPTATTAAEACMTATAPIPTDTPTATLDLTALFSETPTLAGPSATSTSTVAAGPTATPTPTRTPGPTLTPTPTPTPSPTPTPTLTPVP